MEELIGKITLKNNLEELRLLAESLQEIAAGQGISNILAYRINLVLDELVTNIISYAYQDQEEHEIKITITRAGEDFIIFLEDDGIAFDPLKAPVPDIKAPIEERRIGGLGIFFARKFTKNLHYTRNNGVNCLTLRFGINDGNTD